MTESEPNIIDMKNMLKNMGVDLNNPSIKNNMNSIMELSSEIKDPMNMNPEQVKRMKNLLGLSGNPSLKGIPAKRTKIGANKQCPCNSGKKYKKCCDSYTKKI